MAAWIWRNFLRLENNLGYQRHTIEKMVSMETKFSIEIDTEVNRKL